MRLTDSLHTTPALLPNSIAVPGLPACSRQQNLIPILFNTPLVRQGQGGSLDNVAITMPPLLAVDLAASLGKDLEGASKAVGVVVVGIAGAAMLALLPRVAGVVDVAVLVAAHGVADLDQLAEVLDRGRHLDGVGLLVALLGGWLLLARLCR